MTVSGRPERSIQDHEQEQSAGQLGALGLHGQLSARPRSRPRSRSRSRSRSRLGERERPAAAALTAFPGASRWEGGDSQRRSPYWRHSRSRSPFWGWRSEHPAAGRHGGGRRIDETVETATAPPYPPSSAGMGLTLPAADQHREGGLRAASGGDDRRNKGDTAVRAGERRRSRSRLLARVQGDPIPVPGGGSGGGGRSGEMSVLSWDRRRASSPQPVAGRRDDVPMRAGGGSSSGHMARRGGGLPGPVPGRRRSRSPVSGRARDRDRDRGDLCLAGRSSGGQDDRRGRSPSRGRTRYRSLAQGGGWDMGRSLAVGSPRGDRSRSRDGGPPLRMRERGKDVEFRPIHAKVCTVLPVIPALCCARSPWMLIKFLSVFYSHPPFRSSISGRVSLP